MMYLVQGQENTPYLLSFQTVGRARVEDELDAGGILIDPYEVKFQIRDPAGDDIFPGAGDYEVVTGTDGELGTGRFYAYDTAFGIGWTPAVDADLGTYEIEWRWKETASDTERRWVQKFQIEASASYSGSAFATYLCPQQVRDEGISTVSLPAARLESLIELVQSYIERTTRNLFRPVYMELTANGEHHSAMFLQHPIIGIEAVYANDGVGAMSTTNYAVAYERVDQLHRYTPNPDKRRNPSIRFRGSGRSIFDGSSQARSKFVRGVNNQLIRGVFGFLEADGTCPLLIQNAMLRLISLNSTPIEAGSAGASATGPVSSETVDRHSITYSVSRLASGTTKWALAGAKEVEEILAMYKAPIAINAPVPSRVWDTGYEL